VKILNLSLGQDTGGQQMRLQDAWPLYYPDDEYFSMTSTHTFYPIKHRYNLAWLSKELWPNAEVIHLNNDLRYIERFRQLNRKGKALVIHHHGTMFRTRLQYHLDALQQYRAVAITSTLDLHALAPDQTTWIPQSYQLAELQSYRKPIDDGIIRIAHAPTNRGIKGTSVLQAAVHRLRKEGAPVELDIIERRSNHACMTRKGTADIFVDQMILGYGCNAIEAWGMGIPVIAGVDPERARSYVKQDIPDDTLETMASTYGDIPFYQTTETELYDHLLQMVESKKLRTQYSKKGTAHFMKFHEAEVATTRLRSVYEKALGQ
jgi:hypothetical protein